MKIKLPTTHPHAFLINLVIEENYNIENDAIMKCIALLGENANMDEISWSIYKDLINRLLRNYDKRKYRIYRKKILEAIDDKNIKLIRQLCSVMYNAIKPYSLNELVMRWTN